MEDRLDSKTFSKIHWYGRQRILLSTININSYLLSLINHWQVQTHMVKLLQKHLGTAQDNVTSPLFDSVKALKNA